MRLIIIAVVLTACSGSERDEPSETGSGQTDTDSEAWIPTISATGPYWGPDHTGDTASPGTAETGVTDDTGTTGDTGSTGETGSIPHTGATGPLDTATHDCTFGDIAGTWEGQSQPGVRQVLEIYGDGNVGDLVGVNELFVGGGGGAPTCTFDVYCAGSAGGTALVNNIAQQAAGCQNGFYSLEVAQPDTLAVAYSLAQGQPVAFSYTLPRQ